VKKALAIVILFIVVLEVLGRIIIRPPIDQNREFVTDSELGWVLPAGQQMRWENQNVQINSVGLRSPAIQQNIQKHILFVGDSSVFGDGVSDHETMTSQLQKLLGQNSTINVQNGGVPGYTCLQSRIQIQRLANYFQPDILVVNNMHSDYRQIGPTDQVVLKQQLGWFASTGLGKVYSLLNLQIRLFFGESKLPLDVYKQCLSDLAQDQQNRGGKTIFVVPITEPYFPDSPVYGEPEPDPPGKRLADYKQAMQEVSTANNSPFVDPAESMIQRGLQGSQMLLDVVHPSAQGHRVIAETVHSVIQQNSMLQPAQ
jgi:lysophospholipase L1-like esterase